MFVVVGQCGCLYSNSEVSSRSFDFLVKLNLILKLTSCKIKYYSKLKLQDPFTMELIAGAEVLTFHI